MRLAKQSVLYFVSDLTVSVVGFLGTLYFARVLGADVLGQYFVVIALLGWLSIPTNGISLAVNKRVSEGGGANDLLSAGIALNLLYGLLVVVVIVIGDSLVESYVGADASILIAALFVPSLLFTLTVEALKGGKKVATAGFLRTGERVARTTLQIGLIYVGHTLFGLLVGHIWSLALTTLVGLFVYGYRPELPTIETIRSLVSYGRYSWLGDLKSNAFSWMDTLVLALFVSSGLVGVYEVSWRIASILVLVSNAVEHTLFPEISEISADGDLTTVRSLLSEALFYAGIFTIPGLFGALVLGAEILRIYGPEFTKGAPILQLLILARAINVYEMQMLNAVNGIDRPDIAFRINGVFVATNVVLNVLLIWQFGWYGAAVATGLSSLVIFLLSYWAISDLIGTPDLPVRGVGQQVLASSVMALAVVGTQRLLPVQNMYVTVGLVGAGAGVYGVVLYLVSGRIRSKVRSLAVA